MTKQGTRVRLVSRPQEVVDVGLTRMTKVLVPVHGASVDLRTVAAPSHDLILLLQLVGRAHVATEFGHREHLAPGQWAAFRIGCLTITPSGGPVEQVAMLARRADLAPDVDSEDLRPHVGTSGLSKLACHAAAVFFHEIRGLRPDHGRIAALGEPLCRWMALAIEERLQGELNARPKLERLRQRAREIINTNLTDPRVLSVARIARQLNCAPRTIQKAFQAAGQSIRAHIMERRLHCCYMDLLDRANIGRSVAEVALMWGFRSAPHFGNLFRRRFGISPGKARELGAALDDAGNNSLLVR